MPNLVLYVILIKYSLLHILKRLSGNVDIVNISGKGNRMNKIPEQIIIKGVLHILLESRENSHFRALVLPVGGGNPVWLTNNEVGELST